MSQTQGQIQTLLTVDSSALSAGHACFAFTPAPLGKGESVGNGAIGGKPLVSPPSIPAAEKPQRWRGLRKLGRKGWNSQGASLFIAKGSSNSLQRSQVGRGIEGRSGPHGGLSPKIRR